MEKKLFLSDIDLQSTKGLMEACARQLYSLIGCEGWENLKYSLFFWYLKMPFMLGSNSNSPSWTTCSAYGQSNLKCIKSIYWWTWIITSRKNSMQTEKELVKYTQQAKVTRCHWTWSWQYSHRYMLLCFQLLYIINKRTWAMNSVLHIVWMDDRW